MFAAWEGAVKNTAAANVAGFEGAVTGMSIADLLQIKGMARFTGRISIEHGRNKGLVFFRDGDVIHAEMGGMEGRSAFDRIMQWGGGTFQADPKITTSRQTISDSLQFLLLDALRLSDEAKAGGAAEDDRQMEQRGNAVTDRLAGISGLNEAVLTSRDGEIMQSLGSDGDTLAATGMYLVMTSGKIGEGMGLGAFKAALVQGGSGHILALEGAKNFFFAQIEGSAKPTAVENEIKRALTGQGRG